MQIGSVNYPELKNGEAADAAGIQVAGVLDDLFAYDGPLGANATEDGVKIDIWALTAQVTFRTVLDTEGRIFVNVS